MVRVRSFTRPGERSDTARANRRRQLVFGGVLAVSLLASLGYVFQRPALYLATARWQFVFPESNGGAAEPASTSTSASGSAAFLTELQVVTSRPLLEKLNAALETGGASGAARAGTEPVDELQRSIDVRPVPGTTIVEVSASGARPAPLPTAINTLFDLYRRELDSRYQERSGDEHVKARAEADALTAKVARQRIAINAFRQRHAIVSGERDENEVLARFKGQSAAFNLANEKRVAAEARLHALRDATAAGKAAARSRENPALAQLEQRYAQARDEMRSMERSYTEAYMTLDPNAKALRARVASLEEQLVQARLAAQQSNLAEAETESVAARSAADQLAGQMSSTRRNVQDFSARMAEQRSMQDDLDRLEKLRGAAETRATALEAGSRRIAPTVAVLEPAAMPREPWKPDYRRDAVIAAVGSFGLALLALALLELLNRPPAAPPTAVLLPPPGWDDIDTRPWVQQRSLGAASAGYSLAAPPPAPVGLLEASPLPRELDDAEITALLDAAPPAIRPLVAGLLAGLRVDELVGLEQRHVDAVQHALRLPDRSVMLTAPLLALFLATHDGPADEAPDAPLLVDATGRRASVADVDAGVVFAAHDAGLARASEIDAAALRHTFVAHLLRQGARFADLARWTGPMALAELSPYGAIASGAAKKPAEQIDALLPALRRLA